MGCSNTTPPQSTKGVCLSLVGAKLLQQFMIQNKLHYKNKTKAEMCAMIVERKKNEELLDKIMYSEDFDGRSSKSMTAMSSR